MPMTFARQSGRRRRALWAWPGARPRRPGRCRPSCRSRARRRG